MCVAQKVTSPSTIQWIIALKQAEVIVAQTIPFKTASTSTVDTGRTDIVVNRDGFMSVSHLGETVHKKNKNRMSMKSKNSHTEKSPLI